MYKLEPLPYIIQHTGELVMAILNYTNKARRFKSFMHSQIHVFFFFFYGNQIQVFVLTSSKDIHFLVGFFCQIPNLNLYH